MLRLFDPRRPSLDARLRDLEAARSVPDHQEIISPKTCKPEALNTCYDRSTIPTFLSAGWHIPTLSELSWQMIAFGTENGVRDGPCETPKSEALNPKSISAEGWSPVQSSPGTESFAGPLVVERVGRKILRLRTYG